MWNQSALQDLIRDRLSGHQFFVVANREPYVHQYAGREIQCLPPVSGMVSALDPILRASGGKWIAHGSGNADRRTADTHGRLMVPPDDPKYTLRRLWLTREQEDGYYNGLANQGLWPLCHMAFNRPVFDPRFWPVYGEVNEMFARATIEEAGDEPTFVFVQDYHFALLPRMLKEANANLVVAQFWHIPWPGPQAFQTFPWKEELLDGLLGNDLLGFHLRSHCLNFLETVERTLEAKVDYEKFEVTRKGRTTVVRAFPISIDFEAHHREAESPAVQREMEQWQQRIGLADEFLGIGIDRIDYTKGIPERLRALDRFLERNPEFRGRVVFVQIGVPSRTHVPAYQHLDDEIDQLVDDINWRWGFESWKPIVYLKKQYGPAAMMALHRLARFCIVSSLDDGMNLVAKEFVASRTDGDGTLILSQFTGAARELTGALLVNPFAADEMSDAILQAVSMPEDDRRRRMAKMREAVAENNVYRWAGKFLSALTKFEFPEASQLSDSSFAGDKPTRVFAA
ncbi:MAG TPA: trehalose-6-phosphate synthase [Gemmataceae bacterium]|jgi:trehalose 6-phosphate synthase|nr:trehalose-6-phosphate synthase [Gemmataceae bacterium]